MSMNPEQESFEELRRLLALKRHEQPPPGYFHEFSRQVIARIRADERPMADSFFGRLIRHATWLRPLTGGFEAKPILAGAFGVGVCGLLVVGLVSSERTDSNPGAPPTNAELTETIFAKVPAQTVGASFFERAAADHTLTGSVFTAASRSSIFDEIRRPQVQPVSFSTPPSGN